MADPPDQPLSLDAISPPDRIPSDSPDDKARAERDALRRQKLRADLTHRQRMGELRQLSFRQDIDERKRYANKIFGLVAVWLAAVFVVVVAVGLRRADVVVGPVRLPIGIAWQFALSDKVLMTIVAGTTIDVIGLFVIVANYLFYKPGHRGQVTRKGEPKPPAKRRGTTHGRRRN